MRRLFREDRNPSPAEFVALMDAANECNDLKDRCADLERRNAELEEYLQQAKDDHEGALRDCAKLQVEAERYARALREEVMRLRSVLEVAREIDRLATGDEWWVARLEAALDSVGG
jgi:hypothetical protein